MFGGRGEVEEKEGGRGERTVVDALGLAFVEKTHRSLKKASKAPEAVPCDSLASFLMKETASLSLYIRRIDKDVRERAGRKWRRARR